MTPRPGLFHVTGEPDSGKTTFALTAGAKLDHTIFLDNDMKSQSLVEQLVRDGAKFGLYHNLVRDFKKSGKQTPLDFYNMTMKIIDSIKPDKYELLVFDDWTRMEDGIRAYSMTIMKQISPLTEGQIRNMSMLTWPYTYNVYSEILDRFLSIAPTVIMTTHIREKWLNNKPTGIFESRGQRPLVEKTNFRIWLRHNGDPKDGGAPIGLVLKRPLAMKVIDGQLQAINVLPRRIKPCTWARIEHYYANPVGDSVPDPTELPTDFERSVLDGILTQDQKDALRLARLESEREAEETTLLESEALTDDETTARVLALKGEGKPIPVIAREVGLSPAVIARIVSSQ